MAKGLNKVMLIGHLGKDPELSYTPSGVAVAKFSIATNESYKGDDGNLVEKTEWHNITAWRKLAEICSTYLKKGSKVYLEGKLQTDSYEKDGKKNYFTKVVISDMVMLDSKGNDTSSENGNADIKAAVKESASGDDDLPF
ncbi:MAG: single-stranded DNA-binding protein [Ignavibacteria bacterium]|nr:single-stranded DNA-binding protein [Ignavibacteria bacterium]